MQRLTIMATQPGLPKPPSPQISDLPTDAQIASATATLVKAQLVSTSLLQRHFHPDYQSIQDLINALAEAGVITTGANGALGLAAAYREGDDEIKKFSLRQFSGCDGGDLGLNAPSIWVWGVEHGAQIIAPPDTGDEEYSIEATQLHFRFNCNVFKLLATMQGESARKARNTYL